LVTASRSVGSFTSTRRYDLDVAGRLQKDTVQGVLGIDRVTQYEYYPNGSLKRKQLPDGTWTGVHTYDAAGRLSSIDNANAASSSEPDMFLQSVQYNARGQVTSYTHGNAITTTMSYNAARGWLDSTQSGYGGGGGVFSKTYSRHANGAIASTTIYYQWLGSRSWAYTYDGLDRLTLADSSFANPNQDRAYRYDQADNMVFNSDLCGGLGGADNIVYPAQGAGSVRPHAPTSICGVSVSYDANGNTTSYDSDGTGPKLARSFIYHGENRPLSITATGATTTFEYGPDGERVKKTLGANTTRRGTCCLRQLPRVRCAAKVHWTFAWSAPHHGSSAMTVS
jgi:hypothetical protein